jgi:hypothetical protein
MIHYVERCGAKVVRTGSVPCERSVPQPHEGCSVEIVSSPVSLPARWHEGAAYPLTSQPSSAHFFNYDTQSWELDLNLAWDKVRADRDYCLAASDWVRLRAADLGEPVPLEWLTYRQALRGRHRAA